MSPEQLKILHGWFYLEFINIRRNRNVLNKFVLFGAKIISASFFQAI